MNKKFLSAILFGALMIGSTGTFTSCKDYDDDIKDLQGQIDANKTAIEKINALVNGGSVITGVTKTDKGVTVTLSNNTSFELTNGEKGTAGSVVEIGENGNWWIDGKDTGKPSKGDATSGTNAPTIYYEPGTVGSEDGYWIKVTIADGKTSRENTNSSWVTKNTITVAETESQYVIKGLKGADGKEYGDLTLNKYSALFVSSLTYIPSNISDELGDIVFLPVIGTDYNSIGTNPVYEYNLANTKFATTLVDGWADFNYQVNPGSVSPDNYTVTGFTMKSAWYEAMTRAAAATTLNVGEIIPGKAGALTVKANAKDFALYSTAVKSEWKQPSVYANVPAGTTEHDFNNPAGVVEESPYSDDILAVNTASLRVSNKNEDEANINGSSVDAPYVAVARMVVPQEETSIALNVTKSYIVTPEADRAAAGQKALDTPNLKELSQMYTKAEANVQSYLAAIPVLLDVPFAGTTNLNEYVKGIAREFMTSTGFTSKKSQYLLDKDLNFDAPTFKFSLESFKQAEVDQTTRYLKLEDGVVSFDQAITAAINREPIVKVQMYVGSTLVMTKLLKMKVINMVQGTLNYPTYDLGTKTLGCQPLVGIANESFYTYDWAKEYKPTNAVVDNKLAFDFDAVFNKLGMSKDQFVNTYSYASAPKFTKDGNPYQALNIGVNTLWINGSATTSNNYVYYALDNTLLPGEYEIELHMTTNSETVAYKDVYVTAKVVIQLPTITAPRTTMYWSDENTAELNVNAPETGYTSTECIFMSELNSLFKTTNKVLDLTFNPNKPTAGDYDCVQTKYRFTADTKVLKADGSSAGVVTFDKTTDDRLIVKVGGVDVAKISSPSTTGQTIELIENATVKALLSTGALKITNLNLIAEGLSKDILVKKFDVNFSRPLTLAEAAVKSFKDAQDMGDDLKLTDVIALTDWRNKAVVIDGAKTTNLEEFYAVQYFSPAMFVNTGGLLDNSKIYTNLKKNTAGDYAPDNSITTLAQAMTNKVMLPDYTKLTVKGTTTSASTTDSDWVLNYKTNMSTLLETYYMWVPVTVTYKWGTVTGYVKIAVDPVN
ncbi:MULTISPECIES: PL29 family lyase N-terminal domain-containing protein [Bacteroides]|jgi:hypothetical protein|uniref:PL29 family lyase N-terminal domain-containing protein n=1 Tax=Bacteroides TaxID=816 RepID=UPI000E5350F2|nr:MULTISPECIES: PL29 family lyase N-terminal domain-containing protein [Bacteroides]RHL02393.1 hypothetical protein DW036_25125 [Bacteroides sp. AF39-11AC]